MFKVAAKVLLFFDTAKFFSPKTAVIAKFFLPKTALIAKCCAFCVDV